MAVVGVDVPPAALPAPVHAERVGVPGQLVHPLTLRIATDTPGELPGFCLRHRDAVAMTARIATTGGGRPHKGDRWLVSTRLPRELADELRGQAEREDLAYSDVLVNAVAAYYGKPAVIEPRASQQDRLIA